ncbi:MAG: signal peptide peptidase SppA [Chakrabartia godavariana]
MVFLGKAWRFLVGVKDALVLVFMLLFFGAIYMLLSSSPNAARVEDGALLVALDGSIVEQPQSRSPTELLSGATNEVRENRLRDVVHGIETAATDHRVKAIALDLDSFWGGGQVALQRVGQALDTFRKSGKPVVAFATAYSDDSYLLAAHASEVWLDPMGMAFIAGPGGTQPYFKGLIDKLGVNVHVYRVGKFKSFVEPYTRTEQSPEAKAAGQALADALFTAWKGNAKAARPKAKVEAYIANPQSTAALGSYSQAALTAGLVDRLGDRIAWSKRIAEIAGTDSDAAADSFRGTEFADYLAAHPYASHGGKVGVVTVAGNIVDGEAPAGTAGGETLSRLILDAVAQGDLDALVVRIDSPGGSALAAERIRLALLEAKRAKLPVIVSMGNVAASGGYWIATAGDKVFAEPATVTGSIGVFGILPTFENTAAKIGISGDGIATTPLSGQPDVLRGTNAVTDQLMQGGVEDIYRRFTGLVATSRKLPLPRVQEIAQGRVWDGGTARQIGLVDAFGSLDEAVAEAARRAKLDPEKVRPVYLDRIPSWMELLAQGWFSEEPATRAHDAWSRLILLQQAQLATGLADGLHVLSGPAVQVRCLSCPAVPRLGARETFIKSWLNKVIS